MKTQRHFALRNLVLVIALLGFTFPSSAREIFREIHYRNNHQYVYYPKQNFYYDPMFGQYIYVENGVWVREPYPPKLLRRININVLPHTDLYMTSMFPYHYNAEHRRTYHLMIVLTPSTTFYAFRMPYRYDFSIGAYTYYRPVERFAIVDYNPNYYCHPHANPHRYHEHDNYGYLMVFAERNDYPHHGFKPYGPHPNEFPFPHGPMAHHNNHGYDHPSNNHHGPKQTHYPWDVYRQEEQHEHNDQGHGHGHGHDNFPEYRNEPNGPMHGPKQESIGNNGHGAQQNRGPKENGGHSQGNNHHGKGGNNFVAIR